MASCLRSVVTAYGSPRRLAIHLTNVAKKSADASFRQKLLPVAIGLDSRGKATAALQKKLAALGIEAVVKRLKRESDGKQEVLIYEGEKPGELLLSALQPVIEEAIAAAHSENDELSASRRRDDDKFVRPAHI